MTLPVWTKQQILDQMVSGAYWSGSVITYSFPASVSDMTVSTDEAAGFSQLSTAEQDAAKLALQLWADLIPITFTEQENTTTDIEFGMSSSMSDYAHTFFPQYGSVWFSSAYTSSSGTNDLVTPKIGKHGFESYLHEIGHALGLNHTGDYNGDGATPSSYQDSQVYSVMSYFGPNTTEGLTGEVAGADWVSGGQYYEPQTPMLNDIMAIQSIYGVSTTTRTGDTTYGFNSNITGSEASIFDFSENAHPILTIFDSEGNDTLDLSGFVIASNDKTGYVIDLRPGGFSSCAQMTSNIAIAYNCTIENAVGGQNGDQITGNDVANMLEGLAGNDTITGGAGNDTIDGGTGTDVAVFAGDRAGYTITENVDGSFTVTDNSGDDGSDTLVNVESVQFEDGTSALISAPLLTSAIASQQTAQGSAFVFTLDADTFTDPDGLTLTLTATLANDDPLPSWLSFDAATATFSGTPANGDVGSITVRVTATDTAAASVSTSFGIDVANVNDAPTVAHAIADQTGTSGSAFAFTVAANTFSDIDIGDTLTLSATRSNGGALPSWLHFDAASRTFSGTPDTGDVGSIEIKVTASDGSLSASDTFALEIDKTNAAPTDIKLSATSILEDAKPGTAVGTLSGIDPDSGDTLSFSLDTDAGGVFAIKGAALVLAAGASLDFETRSSYKVTVRVTDAGGLHYSEVMTISVTDVLEPIVGTVNDDVLHGTSGADILEGLAGDDTLRGGPGADKLLGGVGNDTATYAAASSSVVANLLTPSSNRGEAVGDSYSSIENLTGSALADRLNGNALANRLSGGSGNDILSGGAGSDVLVAGAGNDRINGGTGSDWLMGGLGNDVFILDTTPKGSNVDTIIDFNHASDTIDIDNAVFAGLTTGTLASTAFRLIARATSTAGVDLSDRILYDRAHGDLYFDRDGSGDKYQRVLFAHVADNTGLNNTDLHIV